MKVAGLAVWQRAARGSGLGASSVSMDRDYSLCSSGLQYIVLNSNRDTATAAGHYWTRNCIGKNSNASTDPVVRFTCLRLSQGAQPDSES